MERLYAVALDPRCFGRDRHHFVGPSQGWKSTGAIKAVERRPADGSLRHDAHWLMSWAVANAHTEPKGNAIIIAKQASGSNWTFMAPEAIRPERRSR
jgi:phage terminase large subunit-like protein